MKQFKNRKLLIVISCVIFIIMEFVGALPLNAEETLPYMSSTINSIVRTNKNSNRYYSFNVTILGSSDIQESNVHLMNCTFVPKVESEAVDYYFPLTPHMKDGKQVELYGQYMYDITFTDLQDVNMGNDLVFTVMHKVEDNYYAETLTYDVSRFMNRDNSSNDNNGDDEEDEDKPIAALKPHLIVDGYSYGQAVAGQDVPLTFTLKNTSKSKIMRNIVLNVKAAGDLRIKSSSDTIYIDSVDPGETITKTVLFALGAAAKEEVQVVGLTSTFEYFDIEGQDAAQGGDTVSISIPTDTLERVKIQKVELPEMLYPNMEEEIAYSVINSGFSTLYNAEVKVVDEAGTEYADVYIGSIEPSKAVTEPYLSIILPEAGEKNLKFVLSYENDKLQTQEVSKDFKATVMEMPVDKPPIIEEPMPGEPLPEDQAKTPWLMWALIGGGVLVAIIVLVVVIKVVRKKRREREDEDI